MTASFLRRQLRARWREMAALIPPSGGTARTTPVAPNRTGSAISALPEADPVEAVASSGWFDPAFYSRATGADGGLRALVRHYLSRDPSSRIAPSPSFDSAFYRAAYPDAVVEGTDPFLHYVLQGCREQRYPSLHRAAADARAIKASGAFDEALYLRERRGKLLHSDIVLDYLIHGAPEGARPNRTFDERFVRSYYGAVRRGSRNLFAFTCRHRERPWCHESPKALSAVLATLRKSDLFDAAFYRERYLADRPDLDAPTHYSTEGYMIGFDPSERFSTNQYFRSYPDIARAETNPLHHYERHGKAEGRKGSGAATAIETGGRAPEPGKPWVLIVSHEASLTGAPIVGLKLAERMSDYANVVTWVGRDGPLGERFREASALFVRAPGGEADWHAVLAAIAADRSIAFAVVNSVVSRAAMPALLDAKIPIVALVHEFAEYVKPAGWVSGVVLDATVAVVPARVVRASLVKELADLRVPDEPANVVVRPQGRCELKAKGGASPSARQVLARLGLDADRSSPIVLGCGFVQIRKGVDLFIEIARRVKAILPEAAFVWVGGGYKPREDMAYSVYLADQIERSGLAGTVRFVEEQPDLEPFWRLADVFLLPSRLDPFPNVALDAIVEGLPLVCFDGATGIAELAERVPDSVFPVPYPDTAAAADAVIGLSRDARERRRTLAAKRPDLAAAFSIADYADALFALGGEARRKHEVLLSDARRLHADGLFDPAFFQSGLPAWAEAANPLPHRRAGDLAERYVRWRAAGVELARPFPGAAPRAPILGPEPAAREVHGEGVAFAPGCPAIVGRMAHRPVLHAHLGKMPDPPVIDGLRRCASACTVQLTTDRADVAAALAGRGETGSPFLRMTVDPHHGDPLASFLQWAAAADATLIGHVWLPGPDEARDDDPDRIARALDFYGSPDRLGQAAERFDADPAIGLLFPEQAAVRGSPRARSMAAALLAATGLAPGSDPERWPLDLVFWAHLKRLPGLRDRRVLEAVRRETPAVALRDRLDGFGLFLARLCAAAGPSALALHDPGEEAVGRCPVILPH